MKKTYLIMLSGFLISISAKADVSSYDKMLIKYCVPKNGRCDTKATYYERTIDLWLTKVKSTGCSCPSGTKYLDRECLSVKCPAGTYMTIDNYTDNCPSGEKRTLYRN